MSNLALCWSNLLKRQMMKIDRKPYLVSISMNVVVVATSKEAADEVALDAAKQELLRGGGVLPDLYREMVKITPLVTKEQIPKEWLDARPWGDIPSEEEDATVEDFLPSPLAALADCSEKSEKSEESE